MYRYQIVDVPRGDEDKREEILWELGRSGWELIQVLPGSYADPNDSTMISLWFKRSAESDIGM